MKIEYTAISKTMGRLCIGSTFLKIAPNCHDKTAEKAGIITRSTAEKMKLVVLVIIMIRLILQTILLAKYEIIIP
ncbi:MAG TPA: hypothetical protein GX710_07630 [Clostridiales bacterium]|nr:hypothetical protein [Clostridiales bacterium]